MNEPYPYKRYPGTMHLPWSEGISKDDGIIQSLTYLQTSEVVVTEKLDGESISMYRDHIHARSPDSEHHSSQSWVKQLHAMIAREIDPKIRVCGENVFAEHSIHYKELPTYFFVHAIFENGLCWCWDDIEDWCASHYYTSRSGKERVMTAPILYRGAWDQQVIMSCYTGHSVYGGLQEGYVVRTAHEFPENQFDLYVGKFVRRDHVQTDEHWKRKPVIRNELKVLDV